MNIIEDVAALQHNLDQVEAIEKLTMRWVFQAMLDFGSEAYEVFQQSEDEVDAVGEDITREVLDRLSGFNIPTRVYGTVDYRKARYVILPAGIIRQALFIDSKAEKTNSNARIQLSQTSLQVQQLRGKQQLSVNEQGLLPIVSSYNGNQYLTTTLFIHYTYSDTPGVTGRSRHILKNIVIAGMPNGLLQTRYNPHENDSIWLAGPNSPKRNETFRTRLSFDKLAAKARWRVQRLVYTATTCGGTWSE